MKKEDKDALEELERYEKWLSDEDARYKELLTEQKIKVAANDPERSQKIRLLSMIWLDLPDTEK